MPGCALKDEQPDLPRISTENRTIQKNNNRAMRLKNNISARFDVIEAQKAITYEQKKTKKQHISCENVVILIRCTRVINTYSSHRKKHTKTSKLLLLL